MSAYARKMIINEKIFNIDNTPLKHMGSNVSRISSSVNQITKRVSSTDSIYIEDIEEIKQLLNIKNKSSYKPNIIHEEFIELLNLR